MNWDFTMVFSSFILLTSIRLFGDPVSVYSCWRESSFSAVLLLIGDWICEGCIHSDLFSLINPLKTCCISLEHVLFILWTDCTAPDSTACEDPLIDCITNYFCMRKEPFPFSLTFGVRFHFYSSFFKLLHSYSITFCEYLHSLCHYHYEHWHSLCHHHSPPH